MDAEPNSENSTAETDKNPLPVSEGAPSPPPIEIPKKAIPDPASQQDISANPADQKGHSSIKKTHDPLLVHVTKDDELSDFERKTVRFGLWGLGVAVFSLLAASVGAYFIYQQFAEMNSQTGILSATAERARVDSNESTKATQRQLAALQAQVSAAKDQLTEQQRALELSQRPWIKFEIGTDPSPGTDPLTHSIPPFAVGKPLEVPVRITNIGATTAEKLRGGLLLQIVADDKEPIIPKHGIIFSMPGERRASGKLVPGQWIFRAVLYPKDFTIMTFSRVKEDGTTDPITPNELAKLNAGTAHVYLVGETWYSDVFGVRHWTKFCETSDNRKHRDTDKPSFDIKCAQFGGVDNNQAHQNPN